MYTHMYTHMYIYTCTHTYIYTCICLHVYYIVKHICGYMYTYIHTHTHIWSEKVKVLVTESCPTLCNPMDCRPPGSSVYRILQARILEWVVISFSRGSSWSRDRTQVSCVAGRFFTVWATREAHLFIYLYANTYSEKAMAPHSNTLA